MNGTERLKEKEYDWHEFTPNHRKCHRNHRNHRNHHRNHHHMYATHHLPAAVVVAHVNVHTSTDQLTNGIDVVVIPETKKKTRTTTKVKQHETTTNKWTQK